MHVCVCVCVAYKLIYFFLSISKLIYFGYFYEFYQFIPLNFKKIHIGQPTKNETNRIGYLTD